MDFDHPFSVDDLNGERARKALEIMDDMDEPMKKEDLNLDFFRKHFQSMVQNLSSTNYEDVVVSIRFFKSYVLLAKNRDFVEYFLRYTGSLGKIITLFLEHEVPLVVEEALDLLLCIYMFVPIEFSPVDLKLIAKQCVYLFSNGTYSLNLLLLDFIYHVCQRNNNFNHLIIENDAFEKSIDFLLGDCEDSTKLIKKECRTFNVLVEQIFDEEFVPDVIFKICVYFDYGYEFSQCTALSMLEKLLYHGLNLADYPFLIQNFIQLTSSSEKILQQFIKTFLKIKDKEIVSRLVENKDFRNNLAIRCIEMKDGSKTRAKIFKLFTKVLSFYKPEPRGIIIVAAFQGSLLSFIEKKYIFGYFAKLCKDMKFAFEFALAGALTLLSYSIADATGEISDKIFRILQLIGHSFCNMGHDLRQVQDYETIALHLSELSADKEADVNHDMVAELQKFYYNEEE